MQPAAKHESAVVVEDKDLSEFPMGIIYYDGHDSHDDHDENDGHDAKMTSECPIICSSNHIDTVPGLSRLKAKGIYRP